jgi:hypothetical protein
MEGFTILVMDELESPTTCPFSPICAVLRLLLGPRFLLLCKYEHSRPQSLQCVQGIVPEHFPFLLLHASHALEVFLISFTGCGLFSISIYQLAIFGLRLDYFVLVDVVIQGAKRQKLPVGCANQ